MQKWDYKTMFLNGDGNKLWIDGQEVANGKSIGMLSYFKKLGEQGWELVSTVSESVCIGGGLGTRYSGIYYYFKRPIE